MAHRKRYCKPLRISCFNVGIKVRNMLQALSVSDFTVERTVRHSLQALEPGLRPGGVAVEEGDLVVEDPPGNRQTMRCCNRDRTSSAASVQPVDFRHNHRDRTSSAASVSSQNIGFSTTTQ